jgi:hypothetical protein
MFAEFRLEVIDLRGEFGGHRDDRRDGGAHRGRDNR